MPHRQTLEPPITCHLSDPREFLAWDRIARSVSIPGIMPAGGMPAGVRQPTVFGRSRRPAIESPMRITIVTETYFPQVNGVSRTLRELVRHLTDRGDIVQLIHPDYGQAIEGHHRGHAVRSVMLPFYKELFLPLPPFGAVRRAIDAFQPDLVHIATEATLGLSALRFALERGSASSRASTPISTSTAAITGSAGQRASIGRYLRWFHNRTLETYVPSQATIRELESAGLRTARALEARCGRDDVPPRPARPAGDPPRTGLVAR